MKPCFRLVLMAYASFPLVWGAGPVRADQICGGHALSTRLDLTMPYGCLSAELFRRQIDNQDDLVTSQAETAPDLARRLQTFSDWRTSRPQTQRSDESQN